MNETMIDDENPWIDAEEAEKEFYNVIMPKTRAAIRAHVAEADPELKRTARVEYLKEKMTDVIFETMQLMTAYEDYQRRDRTLERLRTGEKIQAKVKQIQKIQGEAISLRPGNNSRAGITEEMIQKAKAYPFSDLIEIKRNAARCFLHEDKTASMHHYPEGNRVYCFSCGKGFDTIDFIMQRDGLSFQQAVKALQ